MPSGAEVDGDHAGGSDGHSDTTLVVPVHVAEVDAAVLRADADLV